MKTKMERRFLLCGSGMLLAAFAILVMVQHLLFGLSGAFLEWHLLYVAGFMLLLLCPLWGVLRRTILRPLARLVEANRRGAEGRAAEAFIPHREIPGDEIGEVMRTRNAMLEELQREEQALRESEARYRTLFENNPHPMWVYDLENFSFLAVNDAAVQHYGYSQEEFFSMTIKDIRPSEDVPALVENVSKVTRGIDRAGVWRHRRKDGSIVYVEITSHTLVFGGRRAELVLANDVTERRRAGEALRESEARFRSLVETTNDCFWEVGRDLRYTYISPRVKDILGYKPEEIIGRTPFDLMPQDEARRVSGMVTPQIEARKPFTLLENTNLGRDGKPVVLETSGAPVFDAGGAFRGYRGIDRDITERKRLEQQLLQAQKMEAVGTLAGGVAHDFNNLLTNIIGAADLALMVADGGARWQEYVRRIPEQGHRAASLISQLLAFSRRAVVEKQPLSMLSLVKETVKMLERTVPETIAVRLSVSGEAPLVNADPTQMQQVLMNLCVNASQAMPNGGELTVGLENTFLDEVYCRQYAGVLPGAHVCLWVRDTGAGMTPEVQARIFEPFFTTKGMGEGTGLGLAMVYGIVKEHGGHVNVYSEAGKGSEFKVYLPAMAAPATPEEAPAAQEPLVGGQETILLVEDSETVMAFGKAMLEQLGYTVLTATSGEEGLWVYRERQGEIDLVLTDVVMPKMGGIELYRMLRQIHPKVRALLVSGYSLKEDVASLRAGGVKGFVQKPFNLAGLGRAVREAIDET